ncbi:MAG TPA: hypothetical protein EYP53_02080 [Candidatus Latescibacteria bacterium]|nr:hypothetical protein [Candidatus Latescibacterota bacterium]
MVRGTDRSAEATRHRDVVVATRKQLHGWWPGKRECTAERMLINPYNGCGIGCFFCYSRAFPGRFQLFHQEGVISVAKDFDRLIADQLDSLDVASCGYLSPVTDPFQPLNENYRLSERIIKVFVERNIPIEFITKAEIPSEAISLIKRQIHSFGQVSILTPDEELRKVLVPGGAPTRILFRNIERLSREDIYAVCRIDPILPYLTDRRDHLEELVERAVGAGAKHIVASVLDIPLKSTREIFDHIQEKFGSSVARDYTRLYTERIDGYLHARIEYRRGVFAFLRDVCDQNGVTFALCMEYETEDGRTRGLNREFMSSRNCEGIDIPIYKRIGEGFYPACDCIGNCLYCLEARCGIDDLAMGRDGSKKDWKLRDYRRWSRELRQRDLL